MPKNTKEYMKNYITNAHLESIPCEICNGKYKKYFKSVHIRSQKHMKSLAKLEDDKILNLQRDYDLLKTKLEEAEQKLNHLRGVEA